MQILDLCDMVSLKRGVENEDRALRIVQDHLEPGYTVRKGTYEEDQRGFDLLIVSSKGEILPIQVKSSYAGKREFEAKSYVPVLVVNPWSTDNKIVHFVTKFKEKFFC